MLSLLDLCVCNYFTDTNYLLAKLIVDEGGAGPRRYDTQYDASAEDSELEDVGDGGGVLRAMHLIDFAGRRPTDRNDNPTYVLASSSADEDSADASSLDLGRYVEGATEQQGTDNRWPAALSAQPPRRKRDASKLNLHTSALQMKPHKAVGGSSKALSADRKDWPSFRSKRRTRSQSELQRMVILGNLLNEDEENDYGRRRISAYGALKRVPAPYQSQSPPAKSRVAAGMRYAGIGK